MFGVHRTALGQNSFGFTETGGCLTDLLIEDQGQSIAPLHRAPWIGSDMPPDAPAHQHWLQGDFLAAPFGPGPQGLHGPAANGIWRILGREPGLIRATLEGGLQGATVIKELSLSAGQPFLCQRHIFIGGQGSLPAANHAMISLSPGAKLSFSRKRWFETLPHALEEDPSRGRSCLRPATRCEDAAEFPGLAGGQVNLHHFPWGPQHEDFVSAVEDPGAALGWTAVVRPDRGDLILALKDPRQLPMTMLWHSHFGRDYAPWNGRHGNCLGIEDGAALPVLGLSAGETPDPLSAAGQPGLLTLQPEASCEIRHMLGAIRWPSGQIVAGIRQEGDLLTISGDFGAERQVAIRGSWLAGAKPSPENDTANIRFFREDLL